MGRQRTEQLIGREDALARLTRALETVTPTRGAFALVSGEAGIGKTRLIDDFATHQQALLARGACVEGVAYAPWSEALWWMAEAIGDAPIARLAPNLAGQLRRLVPTLPLDLTTAPAADDGGPELLFEAVVELLRAASTRPLILVVDDVHWIDPASRELLRYVATNLRRIPILLVVAYRPEDSADERGLIAQLGRLSDERIELDALAPESAATMAELLLGDAADAAQIDRIVRDAAGNPLFVEELVAAGSERVPPTVRDLMRSRFSSLGAHARHLVQLAAAMGARAPRQWLLTASQLDADAARTAAHEAAEAGVLVADDAGGYAFRHALLRQAVVDDLLPDDRVALHRDLALALDGHPRCAVGVDRTAELARHWDAAEEAQPALRWLVAAAQNDQQNYAFAAAAAGYERALVWWVAVAEPETVAGVDRAALLLDAAEAASLAGHVERAAELAFSGLETAFSVDASRGVDAAGRAYPLMWAAGRDEELFAFAAEHVLPVLDAASPTARARFLVARMQYLAGNATPEDTRARISEMMAAVEEAGDPVLAARAHMINAWCLESQGDFTNVDAEYEHAAALAHDAGAFDMLALVLLNHASFDTGKPDPVASLALLDAVDELVERYGLRRHFVPSRSVRIGVLTRLGDLDAARVASAGIDGLYLEGVNARQRACQQAMIDLASGDSVAALARLDATTQNAALHDTEYSIEIAALRADALAWTGDLRRARAVVDEGMRAVAQHGEPYWQGWLTIASVRIESDAAELAAAEGHIDEIERAQQRATAIVTGWNEFVGRLAHTTPLVEAHTCAAAAEHARLVGDGTAAAAAAAADAFAATGMPYYETYFRWRQAAALLDAGNRPGATEILKRARAVALQHGFNGLEAAITQLARTNQLRLGPARTNVDGDEALSVRELEVLRLMVDGRSNPEIAEALYISRHTAAAHVSSILRKLDTSTRVEAVSEALRRGYV